MRMVSLGGRHIDTALEFREMGLFGFFTLKNNPNI